MLWWHWKLTLLGQSGLNPRSSDAICVAFVFSRIRKPVFIVFVNGEGEGT